MEHDENIIIRSKNFRATLMSLKQAIHSVLDGRNYAEGIGFEPHVFWGELVKYGHLFHVKISISCKGISFKVYPGIYCINTDCRLKVLSCIKRAEVKYNPNRVMLFIEKESDAFYAETFIPYMGQPIEYEVFKQAIFNTVGYLFLVSDYIAVKSAGGECEISIEEHINNSLDHCQEHDDCTSLPVVYGTDYSEDKDPAEIARRDIEEIMRRTADRVLDIDSPSDEFTAVPVSEKMRGDGKHSVPQTKEGDSNSQIEAGPSGDTNESVFEIITQSSTTDDAE